MTLLNLVRRDKEMRRIFGKAELKIVEKQLLGVALSPSERTRLSRDIKPKFKIISKLCDSKQEFELKKAQEIKYLINEAKEIILESPWKPKIRKISVFGSTIENQRRLNSDIDMSVELINSDQKDSTKFLIKTQGRVPEKIHLSVFNLLPDNLKKEIKEKGRIIYGKD